MSKYVVELYNPSGELLADISDLCTTRTYSLRRNRAEDIYLTLNLEKAQDLARNLGMGFYQLYAAGINEVRITRDTRPMVGGQLQYVHPRLNQEGATLELRASGFLELLSKRFLGVPFQNLTYTDEIGNIMWQMIAESQTILDDPYRDFGITMGTLQTSRVITDTWAPYGQSLKEILIGLTERVDSVDFDITPEKVFNVYYPGIGTDKTELLLSYPGNITSIGLPQDATTLVNAVYARGHGQR